MLWQHHTALSLGASARGAAVTLAGMMAGFALGGLAAGRLAKRGLLARPLAAYGAAEALVAVLGPLVPLGLSALGALDALIYPLSPALAFALQLAGTIALLIAPAAAMGATIPILASCSRETGTSMAALYALNTLGAVVGVLAVTFVTLPLLGVTATGLCAAALDLAVALWAIRAGKSLSGEAESIEAELPGATDPNHARDSHAPLALAFVSGLVIFTLEVSWFRSIRGALQSTTETFAILLAGFLLPLAVGARVASRLRPAGARGGLQSDPLRLFVALAAAMVLCATPAIDQLDRFAPAETGSPLTPLARFGLVLAILAVPVTLLGVVFPRLLERQSGTVAIGRLYASNTFGAVLGALAAGFIILPAIGATRTSWLAGTTLFVWCLATERRLSRAGVILGLAAASGFLAVHYDSGASRTRVQMVRTDTGAPLFVSEGPDSTVSVVDTGNGHRALIIDGFNASGEGSSGENYMAWMGHLPALAAPRLDDALVICFGTGQTANAVRAHRPVRLDIADLSAAVFRAAPLFTSNQRVLDDPSVHPVVMDGRAFLRRAKGRSFDLVTLEPMAPNFAGTNNLYSREFYELVRSRLASGGVVAQWVPFHLLTPPHMAAIVATFSEAFPYSRLWIDPDSGTGILVGSERDWSFRRSGIPLPLPPEGIAANLALDTEGVRELAAMGEVITDDNQLLSYGLDRLYKRRYGRAGGSKGLSSVNLALIKKLMLGRTRQREVAP